MGARSRARFGTTNIGGALTIHLRSGGESTSTVANTQRMRETCDDVTMAPPFVVDHPLTITKRLAVPYRLNGSYYYPPGGFYESAEYQSYNSAWQSSYANAPAPNTPDTLYWKTRALANLNPFRPKLDLPLFIWELKDLPRMLRDAGFLLSKQFKRLIRANDPGSFWLAFQFGWAPLVSDLLSLLDVVKATEDRKALLLKLEDGTAIRRRLSRGEEQDYTPGPDLGHTIPYSTVKAVLLRNRVIETQKVWFTANSKLVDPLPEGVALDTMSRDIVMGMRADPERLWDFVPWTWLIDYFTNMGDYLEAYGTMTRLQVTRLNLMMRSERTSTYDVYALAPGLSCSNGKFVYTVKRRVVYANPTPSFRFEPFLTVGQIGILGALATTRAMRAVR